MPSKKSEVEELAALYAQARAELTKAGGSLHDDVAPLLTAAGFRLQLLRMDVPAAAATINETLQTLDQAMDHLRALGQTLNPSPAHRGGLKNAFLNLAQQYGQAGGAEISVVFEATTTVPIEIAAALYDVSAAAVAEAVRQRASRIAISVKGSSDLRIRITDDGRSLGRSRNLSIPQRLAREAGIVVHIATRKSTIVSISYAVRRFNRR